MQRLFVRLSMKEGRREEKKGEKESMQRLRRSWQVQRIPDKKEKTCTPKSETHATSRLLHRPVTKEENSPLFRNQRLSLSLSLCLSLSVAGRQWSSRKYIDGYITSRTQPLV